MMNIHIYVYIYYRKLEVGDETQIIKGKELIADEKMN